MRTFRRRAWLRSLARLISWRALTWGSLRRARAPSSPGQSTLDDARAWIHRRSGIVSPVSTRCITSRVEATGGQPNLLTKIGQLEHRIAAIQMALAATPLDDEVRLLLTEQLSVTEDALRHARLQAAKPCP